MSEASWLIDQLIRQNITHFCIAPGSRSTPLVLAAAAHPKAHLHVHFDERGLGFFALGIGKALKAPAALIVTSGTALGNLLPAVMEAHHSATPLILLTADRPPELLHTGANQTTDQTKIFSPFVRFQTDLPPTGSENFFRSTAASAHFYSLQNPPGPVHINCQLREPFNLSLTATQGAALQNAWPRLSAPAQSIPDSKGIILIGSLPQKEDLPSILDLAKRLQWPVFADILSNARLSLTAEQIFHYDWILKGSAPKPDAILHFGSALTSKRALLFAKSNIHVSPFPFLQDPLRSLTHRIQSDIPEFCASFSAATDPDWLPQWKALDEKMDLRIKDMFSQKSDFTEAHAICRLSDLLPSDYLLFLSNSMPIRTANHFLIPKGPVYANRGLSGIDGNIATAAGIATALKKPLLAWIGDQACLHDLNSLPLIKNSRTILIASNNFGGGIFSHLPIGESIHREKLFAAAHPWGFKQAAEMFDLPYLKIESENEMDSIFECKTSMLVELITSREKNALFYKNLSNFLSEDLIPCSR